MTQFDRKSFKASLKLWHFRAELESLGDDLLDVRRTELSAVQARDFGEVCDAMAIFLDILITKSRDAGVDPRAMRRAVDDSLAAAFDRYADRVSDRVAIGLPLPRIRRRPE